MSDYNINNREEVQNALVARVIENAPLRELVRVYSEAVTAAVTNLSDDDLVRSTNAAGYTDIIEHFGLEVPADEPAAEGEGAEAAAE
jgi:hypothetical protein